MFENTAFVCGLFNDPPASLSDSKASEREMSAMVESLNAIPN